MNLWQVLTIARSCHCAFQEKRMNLTDADRRWVMLERDEFGNRIIGFLIYDFAAMTCRSWVPDHRDILSEEWMYSPEIYQQIRRHEWTRL